MIAKQRTANRKDVGEMTVIRNQDGNIITEKEEIRKKMGGETFLNQSEHDALCEIPPTEGPLENITLVEVKKGNEADEERKSCSRLGSDP